MTETKKSGEIVVTSKMLDETRNELKSDIASHGIKMQAGFDRIDSRFQKVETRLDGIDRRLDRVETRLDGIDKRLGGFEIRFQELEAKFDARFDNLVFMIQGLGAKVEKLTAMVHRSLTLHEEQEARNKYVLDGYQNLFDRQNRMEENHKEAIAEIKGLLTRSDI